MAKSALDVLLGPWCLLPARLQEYHAIYEARRAGIETDWKQAFDEGRVEAGGTTRGYVLDDGVAVVSIEGPIARRMNLMSAMSGGSSSELIGAAVQQAVADPRVDGIVLDIDSPGGTVAGTQALAAVIRAAGAEKPLAAVGSGMVLSGGYWIGSAAPAGLYLADSTTEVGSVGVVQIHEDRSGADEKRGVVVTEITAGKYKRIVSAHRPLDEEGRAYIQEGLDHVYGEFLAEVGQHRGLSPEQVHERFGDGRVLMGAKAVESGAVDGIASRDEVIAKVRAEGRARKATKQRERIRTMNREELKAAHAGLHDEILAAGHADGVAAERARISGIQASALPGHDDLVKACIADGSSELDALRKITAAERAKTAEAGKERTEDGKPPVAAAHPSGKPGAGDAPVQKQTGLQISERATALVATKAAAGIRLPYHEAVIAVAKEG